MRVKKKKKKKKDSPLFCTESECRANYWGISPPTPLVFLPLLTWKWWVSGHAKMGRWRRRRGNSQQKLQEITSFFLYSVSSWLKIKKKNCWMIKDLQTKVCEKLIWSCAVGEKGRRTLGKQELREMYSNLAPSHPSEFSKRETKGGGIAAWNPTRKRKADLFSVSVFFRSTIFRALTSHKTKKKESFLVWVFQHFF